jgi:hypothetical protein
VAREVSQRVESGGGLPAGQSLIYNQFDGLANRRRLGLVDHDGLALGVVGRWDDPPAERRGTDWPVASFGDG